MWPRLSPLSYWKRLVTKQTPGNWTRPAPKKLSTSSVVLRLNSRGLLRRRPWSADIGATKVRQSAPGPIEDAHGLLE